MGCNSSKNKEQANDDVSERITNVGNGQQSLKERLSAGVKIVLLGEMSTGKTSLVHRLVKNSFSEKVEPTIGAAFLVHTLNVGIPVKMEIWDTAGQERYRSLAPMYYRGAAAAIVVYSITSKESFTTMKKWVEELRSRASPDIAIVVVGNKADLENERAVTPEMVEELKQELNLSTFLECSAKSGQNVTEVFEEVCKQLVAQAEKQ